MEANEDGELLDELRELRRRTRASRHAYWLPLLVFGVLCAALTPLYVAGPPASGSGRVGPGWLIGLGGLFPAGVSTGVLGACWLAVLLVGAALTAAWYAWRARATGVGTDVKGVVLTWGAVCLLILGLSALGFSVFGATTAPGPLRFLAVWATIAIGLHGTAGLPVIAVGLLVLAWHERSRLLGGIAVGYAACAGLATFYDPENIVFRLAPGFPIDWGGAVGVGLCACVLLIGAIAAYFVEWRAR